MLATILPETSPAIFTILEVEVLLESERLTFDTSRRVIDCSEELGNSHR